MTGDDERSVGGADTETAITLLDRLGLSSGQSAAKLTASQRDRILARIYAEIYGEHIASTLTCGSCSRPFDIGFSLRELVRRSVPTIWPESDGNYRSGDGFRFRLPTGEDELSVRCLPANEAVLELLRRCVLEIPDGLIPNALDTAAVQDAMEQAGPILDVDINTSCPECSAAARVRFDLQSYLLESIIRDRRRLLHETHTLASVYRWSFREIMSLKRSERRSLIAMIEADAARRAVM
jgi:hypothetical protein